MVASWRHIGSRLQKSLQKIKLASHVLGAILGQFYYQIDFICIFCVLFFVLAFWHRFGEASGPNFEDLGVVSGWLLVSF